MTIIPVGVDLFQADGRTDRHDEANGGVSQFFQRSQTVVARTSDIRNLLKHGSSRLIRKTYRFLTHLMASHTRNLVSSVKRTAVRNVARRETSQCHLKFKLLFH